VEFSEHAQPDPIRAQLRRLEAQQRVYIPPFKRFVSELLQPICFYQHRRAPKDQPGFFICFQ
jgi:hypothetical protein